MNEESSSIQPQAVSQVPVLESSALETISTSDPTAEEAQELTERAYSHSELWNKIMRVLKDQVQPESFALWLAPVKPITFQNKVLSIEVPDKFFQERIEQDYMVQICSTLELLQGSECKLEILLSREPMPQPESSAKSTQARPVAFAFVDYINPKHTFETFVQGPSNRFAKAAAEGVAKEPGIRFNPFFLYGGVGLGKTHLMHAIGLAILGNFPATRVLYVSSEKFINEFIDSLRTDRPADFRNKYRNLDCLLVDDIQFLIGKGRSEEEFFYTFNTLFDSRKQIVISSDRSPRELGALQDRLISRFEWGVVADIQPPDLETRIAILRTKAELEKIYVPEDVIHFIASSVKSNIRELEGSLIRIVAYSTLTGTPLTVDTARTTLKDICKDSPDAPITMNLIQEVVAKQFNLEPKELKSKRRTDAIAWPRQIAMYLARMLTELSTTEIGEFFGGKDHTTVLHACEKVKLKLAESPFISSLVNKITQDIKNENQGQNVE